MHRVARWSFWAPPSYPSNCRIFVISRLPVFKRPHAVEFFPESPKTATGKLQRFKLRAVVSR